VTEPLLLAGKGVVITGSSRGLGRAYAIHAARSGAAVVVNGTDGADVDEVVSSIRGEGGRAVGTIHAVEDPEQATALVQTCVDEFGKIDGLVNNAGIFPTDFHSWEEDPGRLRRMVDVNVLGTMYCGVAAVRHMREQRSGVVINVTSRAHHGSPGCAVYASTKGAVASLTYAWAIDLHDAGIRVNAISPFAHTDMTRTRLADAPSPEVAAPLVSYLLSDRARGMTGQNIRLSGRLLGVVMHPRDGIMLERDGWDAESIADAFEQTLAAHLEPVGVVEMRPVLQPR
jgi:NAD(P)-dependent dehydrogenase (short-subunit alcohol dehydrogenase family)